MPKSATSLDLKRQLYELYLARACGVEFVQPLQRVSANAQGLIDSHQSSLASTIAHCKLCPRSKGAHPQAGYIQASPLVFVVELAMGDESGLVDSKASQMLTNIAQRVFNLQHFSVLSLLKCAPHPASPQEIELCKPYLISQIQALNASCLVLFGEVVLESLLGLDSSHKGALLDAFGKKAIATHSITALLRNPSLKKESLEHFGLLLGFCKP